MPRGIVKLFNARSHYGFIRPIGAVDASEDVFVHITRIERAGLSTLKVGQVVDYDIAEGRGRPVATNLRLVKGRD
jgi:CspA family cold shock protein